MDKLSALIGRFRFEARAFYEGHSIDTQRAPEGVAGQLYLVRQGPVLFFDEYDVPLLVHGAALVFYPHGMAHRVQALPGAGAGASVAFAILAFRDGEADPLARILPGRLHLPLERAAPLRHTLELLFAEAAQPAQGQEAVLDRVCDVLMIQLMRHTFEQPRPDGGVLAGLGDRQLEPVLNAMHARPHEPWQLQSLAALACMSRTAFTEHFRKVVGMAPMEYLTGWRMRLARRLLREGLPVKVVSGQAGYTSPPAFTRAFTEHVGMSPRHWLREGAVA